jgi:uncharacterized membrane protein YraQ (UPF0718 family)
VQDLPQNITLLTKDFTGILYEAMPFIVLGVLIAGLLEEFVPQKLVARLIPRNRILAIAIGGFLGILFPMCECGIIPVMRRLLRKGVPLSCCVCYMLAGPIINVVVMLSTYFAFSGTVTGQTVTENSLPQLGSVPMTCLRMGLGFLVGFGTSIIVELQHRRHGDAKLLAPLAMPKGQPSVDDEEEETPRKRSLSTMLGNVTETALHDFVDVTVYLIFGAFLASFSRLFLDRDQINTLAQSPMLSIGVMMGLAILLCICSEADAFVAASFRVLPPASKVAFLVLGPMLDMKLYMMYTRVFRPRLIWTIITCVVVQVFLYSLALHWVLMTFVYPPVSAVGG